MGKSTDIANNAFRSPMLAAVLASYWLSTRHQRLLIDADVHRWAELMHQPDRSNIGHLSFLFRARSREFRNLFYYRLSKGPTITKIAGRLLSSLFPGERTLFLRSGSIGPGLFIQHGFATIVTARAIGANCWINQQVTIGHKGKSGSPTIGDNVRIAAGAIVVGPVTVGDDALIGAGAIVVKDVPPGRVAVSPAATLLGNA